MSSRRKKYSDPENNKSNHDTRTVRKDPRYRELRSQLDLTDLEIRRLARESANLSGQVETYLARIEKSPAREQDMAALMREYNSTKQNYETLLKKAKRPCRQRTWKNARRANNSESSIRPVCRKSHSHRIFLKPCSSACLQAWAQVWRQCF